MSAPLVVSIHPESPDPARKQIADQIRSAIVENLLMPGDELPSVRRLAIDLGVHFNTVAESYRLLSAEGWLDISHGKGAKVLRRTATSLPDDSEREEFRQRIRHLVAEMRGRGMEPLAIRGMLLTSLEGIQ